MAGVMSSALYGNGIFGVFLLYLATRQQGDRHLRDGVVCGLLCAESSITQEQFLCSSLGVFLSLATSCPQIMGLFFASCFLGDTSFVLLSRRW